MAFDGISQNSNARKPMQPEKPVLPGKQRNSLDNLFSSEPLLGRPDNAPKNEKAPTFNSFGLGNESTLDSEQRMLEGLRRYHADVVRRYNKLSQGKMSEEARYLFESSLFELDEEIQSHEDKIRRLK